MAIGYTEEGNIPDPEGPISVYVVEYEPCCWRAHFKDSGYFWTADTAEYALAGLQKNYPMFFRGQELHIQWLRCQPICARRFSGEVAKSVTCASG